MPGGGGNWGGSWLAVPTQSKHPKEAYELAKFLTSPEGQVAAFKEAGPLPSSPKALDDPAFLALTNDYFSNAPVGKIFGAGAKIAEAGRPRPEAPGGQGAWLRARAAGRRAGQAHPRQGLAASAEEALPKRRSDLFQRPPVVGGSACRRRPGTPGAPGLTRADMRFAPYIFIAPFFVLFAHLRGVPADLHRLGVAARLAPDR